VCEQTRDGVYSVDIFDGCCWLLYSEGATMKRHTTQQKGAKLTVWQANKLKVVLADLVLCPEYLVLLDKTRRRLKRELMIE